MEALTATPFAICRRLLGWHRGLSARAFGGLGGLFYLVKLVAFGLAFA